MARLVKPENLENVDARLIAAFSYEPKILKNYINNRRFSALVYVLKGKYIYRSAGQETVLTTDSCIYLPPGGEDYSYEIVSDDTETLQVDFELSFREGTEQGALSRVPIKINSDVERLKSLMQRLVHLGSADTVAGRLELKARMTMLLSLLSDQEENKKHQKAEQKIAPALQCLQKSYREPFDSEELALLCGISQSQLRRLFKTVTGMTPLEYRNRLRISAAARMLIGGDLNVSEVAFAVGFEDIYAFSHAFKKQMGISPSLYQEETV